MKNISKIFLTFLFLALALMLPAAMGYSWESKGPPFLIGDWDSSGEQSENDYQPKYKYSYDCQVQITDRIERNDSMRFQIANFEINNQSEVIHTEDLKWYGKNFYDIEKIEDTETPAPFSTSGNSIYFGLWRGESKELDELQFNLNLQQEIQGLVIEKSTDHQFYRSENEFEMSNYLEITSATEAEVPALMMRVLCEKRK